LDPLAGVHRRSAKLKVDVRQFDLINQDGAERGRRDHVSVAFGLGRRLIKVNLSGLTQTLAESLDLVPGNLEWTSLMFYAVQ
jgi:hypothetical protein